MRNYADPISDTSARASTAPRKQHSMAAPAAGARNMLASGNSPSTPRSSFADRSHSATGWVGPDSPVPVQRFMASPHPIVQMRKAHRADTATTTVTAGRADGKELHLPAQVRSKMEGAFGMDFSMVRVHEGPEAAAMGAQAFTQGADIHFAPGQYQPLSQRGQELLGHEFTHIAQRAQGRVRSAKQLHGRWINDDPGLEREADRVGREVARGGTPTVSGFGASAVGHYAGKQGPIQRKELGEGDPDSAEAEAEATLKSVDGLIEWWNLLEADGLVANSRLTIKDLELTRGELTTYWVDAENARFTHLISRFKPTLRKQLAPYRYASLIPDRVRRELALWSGGPEKAMADIVWSQNKVGFRNHSYVRTHQILADQPAYKVFLSLHTALLHHNFDWESHVKIMWGELSATLVKEWCQLLPSTSIHVYLCKYNPESIFVKYELPVLIEAKMEIHWFLCFEAGGALHVSDQQLKSSARSVPDEVRRWGSNS